MALVLPKAVFRSVCKEFRQTCEKGVAYSDNYMGELILAITKLSFDTSNTPILVGSVPVRCCTLTAHRSPRPDSRSPYSFSCCLRQTLDILFNDRVDTRFFVPTSPWGILPGCGTFFTGGKTENETCNFEQMHWEETP